MSLSLRPARITDVPFVQRGEEAYIRQWEPAHEARWRDDFDRHLARWLEHFERLTIAELDGESVGYSLWLPEAGTAELCTLGVSVVWRGKGVGAALLQRYIADARQEGYTRLTLSVRPDNPARRLYERAGFEPQGSDALGYRQYELRID
ncbi:GNAT family N-acetyltransferase [Pseudomonas nitroreducens]|uniref:GNAT family N-acetyltransferase n=1 Tax=Pseudomonas nitroreducens TaxID=46680 RepID=UPI0020A19851|nr:GNAT family N-acetyltransferase [Pseudomonas nitroreducens]MCP1624958.1 ribosomal protein S18 acetylase RimI-like enzyme [Pseudomonas nitroreducens]